MLLLRWFFSMIIPNLYPPGRTISLAPTFLPEYNLKFAFKSLSLNLLGFTKKQLCDYYSLSPLSDFAAFCWTSDRQWSFCYPRQGRYGSIQTLCMHCSLCLSVCLRLDYTSLSVHHPPWWSIFILLQSESLPCALMQVRCIHKSALTR